MKLIADKIFVFALGLIAGLLLVSGCATSSNAVFSSDPVAAPAPAAITAPPEATIPPRTTSAGGVVFQVGDLIIVSFSDTTAEIANHEERIKEDGNITLPLIGSVKAVGRTPGELQKEIRDKYVPKYYLRLTITVKYQAQELAYSVLGEVRAPGPKSYLGVTTVTKAIGAAGGLTEFASKRKIYLTRANGTKVKINYNKAIANPKDDPQVFPGDAINVEKSIW